MSRSFRRSEAFTPTRAAFTERKAVREERKRQFEALGFDEAEALALRPLHRGYKSREGNAGRILDIRA